MPYYDEAHLVTVTKTNMIDEIPCGYGTLRSTTVRIRHQVSRRPAQRSPLVQKFNYPVSQILKHLRLLLQSLRALWLAQVWPRMIWKYLETLVRATGVARRITCGFWRDLHCVDVGVPDEGSSCSSITLLLAVFVSLTANRCCPESEITGVRVSPDSLISAPFGVVGLAPRTNLAC
jgi:hypothetical protein